MKYIGIVVAMEEERQAIENLMKETEKEQIYNLVFTKGKIEKQDCILVESGVGKVNAARTTQILINQYNPEKIINAGSAGAINHLLEIGDVVIAKQVVQHDFDITAFGHNKGYITGVGENIKCNEEMLNILNNKIKNIDEEYKIKIGIVASGDIFCTNIKMKDKINIKFDADVVDMECAAIAQVAYLDNIPFISIRSVSDIPNGKNETTFEENLKLASERCAKIVKEYCS